MTLEDVELEAAPMEACMEDLDDLCPTDREIAEVEAGVQAPVEDSKPLSWSWSGVKVALIRGAYLDNSMLPQVCKYVEPHTSQTHATQACAAWDVADTHLANLFGLNESKYEWAVREYYYQKRMEAEDVEAKQQANSQAVQATAHTGFEQMPHETGDEGSMLV